MGAIDTLAAIMSLFSSFVFRFNYIARVMQIDDSVLNLFAAASGVVIVMVTVVNYIGFSFSVAFIIRSRNSQHIQ